MSPRTTDRMRRVNESLREVLSEAVADLSDPRLGFVTVTGVRCTPDLDHATVYVQILGGEARRRKGLEALEHARGALQERVAREVRLRRVPRLVFSYDESLDRGLRINALLDELNLGPEPAPEPGAGEPAPEPSEPPEEREG
jgi:ribosome-binding factor A